MMMNLFSIFDPASSEYFSLNWLSSIYVMMFIPVSYWFVPSRWSLILIFLIEFLIKEFKVLLNKKLNLFNIMIFISLFMVIFLNNFMGLFPYIFTPTSHLVSSLTLALLVWFSIFLFSWLKNTNHSFIHLVPQGTPGILMPFMVLVESLSNVIRAGTLSVRLTANMIAGHLLMTLISSTGESLSFILLVFMLVVQSLLITLELSVSVIQAYVFSVLSTLYSAESN
uniref:ATP synthase subunit a n=1 Tax=Diaphorencyrtus aligarhensis TaxID=436678 RepID=A0A6C0M4P7_9HYME|nr:ATP synthase F0 subunit 6 [Diaphorencyrtus aligarhensis]QHU77269.1 ATP synthase F0 subunit 6 [Diaphorencyrtus aligarhensis]